MNMDISQEEINLFMQDRERPVYTIRILFTNENTVYFGVLQEGSVIGYIVFDRIDAKKASLRFSIFNSFYQEGYESLYVIMSYAFAVLKFEDVSIFSSSDNEALVGFIQSSPIRFSSCCCGYNLIKFSTTFEDFKLAVVHLEDAVISRWTYSGR